MFVRAAAGLLAMVATASASPGDVTFSNTQPDGTWFPPVFMINRHNDAHYNGATINLWLSNNHASQAWRLDGQTYESKTNGSFCLNLHNNSHTNGAAINLWSCNGHASQNWVVVGNTLRPASNQNFCVNIHNNVRTNGAVINLWQCNGHQSQNFVRNIEVQVT